MKPYLSATAAISDLHMQGFTNDFQLSGNDLLLVQGGLVIRAGEFTVIKYHKIQAPREDMNDLFVFGIIALYHNVKGILLNRSNSIKNASPVLVKKLNEINVYCR